MRDLFKLSLLLGPAVAYVAQAEVYLSDQKAVEAIFPGGVFQKTKIVLTDAEWTPLKKTFGESLRNREMIAWHNAAKDWVFIDQVLGKHEFITFAVGVTSKGEIKGVEILEYNESYGQKIMDESWRKQFVGKTKDSPLKLEGDIKNISGATLSSAHVTAGVKRILATYDSIRSRL